MSLVSVTAPHVAATSALAAYLQAQLAAIPELVDSAVFDEWPEPSTDLLLSSTRIVVAVTRVGAARGDERLGGPNLERLTVGTPPAGVARYEFGEVEQDIALGIWAESRSARDDVDEIVFGLLNKPYTSTVSLAMTTPTTLGQAAAVASLALTPASMANIWPGALLSLDAGATAELVEVLTIGPTSLSLKNPTRYAHSSGVQVSEVQPIARVADVGLSLRCSAVTVGGVAYPGHLGNVARYDFDDPIHLDDAEDGAGSQREEWRSIRNGTARIRHSREYAATLQKTLTAKLTGAATRSIY